MRRSNNNNNNHDSGGGSGSGSGNRRSSSLGTDKDDDRDHSTTDTNSSSGATTSSLVEDGGSSGKLLRLAGRLKSEKVVNAVDLVCLLCYLLAIGSVLFGYADTELNISQRVSILERGLVAQLTYSSIPTLDTQLLDWIRDTAHEVPDDAQQFGTWFDGKLRSLGIESSRDYQFGFDEKIDASEDSKKGIEIESKQRRVWWGLVRSKRASTMESVVIVADGRQPLAVSLGLLLQRHLREVTWLSKDVLFLVWLPPSGHTTTDGSIQEWAELEDWLRRYHTNHPIAGIIRAALVLNIPTESLSSRSLSFRRLVLSVGLH